MEDESDLHRAWGDALLWVTAIERDGKASVIGNAFLVVAAGDCGLAVTACHVVDELGRLATKGSALRGNYRDVMAHQRQGNLHSILGLRMTTAGEAQLINLVNFSVPGGDDCDVAVCVVAPQVGSEASLDFRFGLKFDAPSVGEPVFALGWSGFEKRLENVDPELSSWQFAGKKTIVTGIVTRAYARKQGVTPGPCFDIEGHFPSGLSGSPVVCVIDGAPYVCGLVSSSDETTAVASMLWPALALSVPVGADGEKKTLFELAKMKLLYTPPGDLEPFSVDGLTVTRSPTSDV